MIDMVYIFFILCTVAIIVALFLTRSKPNNIFHCPKYVFFRPREMPKNASIFEDVFLDIALKKMSCLSLDETCFVDKKAFEDLQTIDGYFYKINCKKMTEEHIKMLCASLAMTKEKLNIFLFDCSKKIKMKSHKNIKLFYCDFMNISIKNLGIINMLNCNKILDKKCEKLKIKNNKKAFVLDNNYDIYSMKKYCENIYNDHDITVSSNYKNNYFDIFCENKNKKNKYVFIKINFKNYKNIFSKKKNKIVIKNIFKETIFEIIFKGKTCLFEDGIVFEIKKNCVIKYQQILNREQMKILSCLNYKILQNSPLSQKVNYLLNSAIKQLNVDYFFALDNLQNTKELNAKNLKTFFMMANLKRDYLRRYCFALEHFFGIKVVDENEFVFCKQGENIENYDLLICYKNKTKIFKYLKDEKDIKICNRNGLLHRVEKLPDVT